jgi:hypothetical protein
MSLIVDGFTYDIGVISLKRTADPLDKFAERTLDGVLHRELIGIYFNYKLQLANSLNTSEYQALWDKLSEPVEFHTITVPDSSDTPYTYTAYISGVSDELMKSKAGVNYWKNLTVNFTAQSPALTP